MRGRSQRDRLRWGRHVEPSLSDKSDKRTPTPADRAASVFDVTYRHGNGNSLCFPVLALDDVHAAVLAEMRMADAGRDVTECVVESCHRRTEPSTEARSMLLQIETLEEWQDRQQRYDRTESVVTFREQQVRR